jgi:hypothetical protein
MISHVAADVGRNQRFCREVRDRFENIGGADAFVGGNRSRCIDGEIALENGKAPRSGSRYSPRKASPCVAIVSSLVANDRFRIANERFL